MTLEQIKTIQGQIQAAINKPVALENPSSVMGKLNDISVLLASASSCIPFSKTILLEARYRVMNEIYLAKENDKTLKTNIPPSVATKFIETRTIKEEELFCQCERSYSALVHCIDALRSILSTIKQEMIISSTL